MEESQGIDARIEDFLLNHQWLEGPLSIKPWGRGETNDSYRVRTARNSYVFRVARDSGPHSQEAAAYEWKVLKALEGTHLAPKPFKLMENPQEWPGPVMLMTWAPGVRLDYRRDFLRVPAVMANLHRQPVPGFLRPWKNPVDPLIMEALEDLNSFPQHPRQRERERLLRQIEGLKPLALSWTKWFGEEKPCFINTQAGASNFIVDRQGVHWLDWDKAAAGSPWVDLAHFANQAATWWEGQYIFHKGQRRQLAQAYRAASGGILTTDEILERITWLGRALEVRTLARVWRLAFETAHMGRVLTDPSLSSRCHVLLDALEDLLH